MAFLEAKRDYIKSRWSEGEEWTEESRHFVQAVNDILDVTYDEIEKFYEESDETPE